MKFHLEVHTSITYRFFTIQSALLIFMYFQIFWTFFSVFTKSVNFFILTIKSIASNLGILCLIGYWADYLDTEVMYYLKMLILVSWLCIHTTVWQITLTAFLFSFFLFQTAPLAYGSSQARGRIRAAAASLYHSHSNTGSELCLRLIPQRMAMLDPLTHWGKPGIEPTSSWLLVRLLTAEP